MDWKALLTSKTIWGILIATAMPILKAHGYTVDADGLANDVVTLAGAALAVWGRATAKAPLVGPDTVAKGGGAP